MQHGLMLSMLRISIFLQLVASVHALSTSQSRLQHALDRLDRNPSVDACLDVIRHVPHSTPIDKARLRALAEEDDAALSTRFFAAKPCDDAARALARGDDEAVGAVAASGRFALLPRVDSDAALDALDTVITSEATLAARQGPHGVVARLRGEESRREGRVVFVG